MVEGRRKREKKVKGGKAGGKREDVGGRDSDGE